jgi:hypothetical protein
MRAHADTKAQAHTKHIHARAHTRARSTDTHARTHARTDTQNAHTHATVGQTRCAIAHLQQPRQRMQALLLPVMVGARFGGRRGDADDV